ncbi:ImuA family protein [Crateriforma spongiae]|uniref:ImuA family protein n=1 Tax=Crateriforma spongiae TaxID=2724528 RepID=UPI0039B0C50B
MATQQLFDFAAQTRPAGTVQADRSDNRGADSGSFLAPPAVACPVDAPDSVAASAPDSVARPDRRSEIGHTETEHAETGSEDRQALLGRLSKMIGGHTAGEAEAADTTDPNRVGPTAKSCHPKVSQAPTFSTGCDAVDAWLPRGGLRTDGITEWVSSVPSGGALTLAMVAAAGYLRNDFLPDRRPIPAGPGRLAVVDPHGHFYPPALTGFGIDPAGLLWCRTESDADTIWATDQLLRSGCVGLVIAWAPRRLDDRDARRFQLAAETGRTPGLLLRGSTSRGRPSFADTRFHVASRPLTLPRRDEARSHRHRETSHLTLPNSGATRRSQRPSDGLRGPARRQQRLFQITLDRCKGGMTGRSVLLSIDHRYRIQVHSEPLHEKAAMRLASRLADPKTADAPRRDVG